MKTRNKQTMTITNNNLNDFRSNLKKYYLSYGEDSLYVKPQNGQCRGIKFSKISSLSDLYEILRDSGTPSIVPKVVLKKDIIEYMTETNQFFSSIGYFDNIENFEIIDNTEDFLENHTPSWIGIDNQLYREFFYLTLGEYSGYSIENNL